ncbi:MAG: hypothetical protein AAF702_45665 [Chloroflexota bacterium]
MNTIRLRISTVVLALVLLAGTLGSIMFVDSSLESQTQGSTIDLQSIAGDHEGSTGGG